MRIGRTAQDFVAAYDKKDAVSNKMRAGLKALGADRWCYEGEFTRIAGISVTQLGANRDKFSKFFIYVKNASGKPRRIWCGSVALAERLKSAVTQ
jgi:hypothetical protein